MEALRETTVWEGETQPNHVYLFDGSKAVAYIKWGEGEPYYFKKPMAIDKRGRTFEKADTALFNAPENATENAILEVQGSKGKIYYVNTEERTCTCPGYTFRGNCKHVEAL